MAIWEDSDVQDASNATDVVRAVESTTLHDAILAAVGAGWLISFGGSRDGFSVSVGVIVDGQSERKWHTSAETLGSALERVVRAAELAGVPKPRNGAKTAAEKRRAAKRT